MTIGFEEALAALGLLLVGAATVSGLVGRSVLSLVILSVGAGAVMDLTGVLAVDVDSFAIVVIVELVLLMTLFADGLLVEQSFLRHHWRAPARALVLAMPVNAALLAVLAKTLFGELSWAEAFLVGFVLSPTDPVITSSVVSSVRVPDRVRNLLNLESGLNDGLALPFVAFFIAVASDSPDTGAGDLVLETFLGLAIGGALGYGGGALLSRLPEWALTHRYEGLYALGIGLAGFGIAELAHGNGLIAAFVAGVSLALSRHEMPEVFIHFNEGIANVLQIVAFVVFGAIFVDNPLEASVVPLIAFAVIAIMLIRPASILLSFVGVTLERPEKAFVAWFGPKGIASILFALFALKSGAPEASLVFDIASITILASVIAHGLTDTIGASWIERHMAPAVEAEDGAGA